MTATALLDQLIIEGTDQLDYPGIVFRGPAHDRRAALASGPDVWEILARLQELDGHEEQRISLLAAESDLHPGSSASPWITQRNTPSRSVNGSTATGSWPSGAATHTAARSPAGVTAFHLDETFPSAAAAILRTKYGHEAVQVGELGLRAADDTQVAAAARAEGGAVVTENMADFAAERELVLVFILKKNLPAGGGQAAALARVLNRWAEDHPDPYLGHHWPATD